jgi:hypothetical protein
MRRVGVVNPHATATAWKFDDRTYLTLTSEWITLAPGDNAVLISMDTTQTTMPTLPQVFWRDTWVG